LGFFQTAVKANRKKVFPARLPAMQTKENVYMEDSGLSIEIERPNPVHFRFCKRCSLGMDIGCRPASIPFFACKIPII
jgi:hypothetical protein